MASLHEGDRIHNYLLEARVGAGSYGEVWRARHHIFGEVVAIKVPTDPQYVRNLQREGVAIHGLRHPNIVRAIDMDPYADPPYLIMEYVDGPSLRAVIEDQRNRFPIPAIVAIMRGTLNALGASHRNGVIHRDLKPANILLAHPRESIATIQEHEVKVADFGLGLVGGMTAQAMTQSGSISAKDGGELSGTLAYMSPEQKEGAPLDARSDLYSCGIILFEMLTGERPQGTELPGSLRPDVPSYLEEIVRRSYTRLDRRYKSAAEMLTAFVPASSPPPLPPRVVRNEQSHQRSSAGGGLVLIDGVAPRCSGCDQPVHRDDQFCIRCGKQLVESVPRCGVCQAYVHPNDRFCIFCGKDLGILT